MKRIGFTGHRDCVTDSFELAFIHGAFPGAIWVHGAAKSGFDKQVDDYAKAHGIERDPMPPEYDKYPPRVAPIMRNKKIVDSGIDILYACWDGRQRGGTFQTKNYAIDRGVQVVYVDCRPQDAPDSDRSPDGASAMRSESGASGV